MKGKIKNLFSFISRAWHGGIYGKGGVILVVMAIFVFIRMFFGTASIQNFVINIWRLDQAQTQSIAEHKKLDSLNHRIELLQNYSPDYVEELGQKHLNVGNPRARVLKF